jgi:hypothetical protein
MIHTRCLSLLDFWKVILKVYYKLKKKSISEQDWSFVKFELDFYCLCSLQKSIPKSNWFFDFLNLIFWNWKKIEWHSIFQKSSGDRQGDKYLVKMHVHTSKWEWSLRNYFNSLCILSSLHRANDNICLNLHVLVPCATMGIWGWGVVYYYWYYPVDICN